MAFSPVFECKHCKSRNAIWHIQQDRYEIICRGCGHAGTVTIKLVQMTHFLKDYVLDEQQIDILKAQWHVVEKFLNEEKIKEVMNPKNWYA